MIRAVLVDDEPDLLAGLKSILARFCPEVQVVGESYSIHHASDLILQEKPELVLLDIEMGDGSGFDLLENMDDPNFMVIFITAHNNYMKRAIRVNALDYILKPVDPEELIKAIERCKNRLTKQQSTSFDQLFPVQVQQEIKKIGVPTKSGVQFITTADILRLEANSNYTFVHLLNKKPVLVSKTLKAFEAVLPEQKFLRIHQSHIVNIEFVTAYEKSNGDHLTIADHKTIPVSRSQRSKVRDIISGIYPLL